MCFEVTAYSEDVSFLWFLVGWVGYCSLDSVVFSGLSESAAGVLAVSCCILVVVVLTVILRSNMLSFFSLVFAGEMRKARGVAVSVSTVRCSL